jgi:hypothetical protein
VLAAVSTSFAFYLAVRWGQSPPHSIFARISDVAIATLRGLAAALFGVSIALGLRLRAQRYRSSGPER